MKKLFASQLGMSTVLIIVLVAVGVIIVGVVGTAAVILSNSLNITVNNRSCGTLDVAEGAAIYKLNFLPGINIPAQIDQGDIAVVQVPRRFIDSVSISTGSIEVRAASQSFMIGTSSLDMQRCTLDGTPLNGWIGRQIDVSKDHTLVLECK